MSKKPTVIYGESDHLKEERREAWERAIRLTPEQEKQGREALKRAAWWYDWPLNIEERENA